MANGTENRNQIPSTPSLRELAELLMARAERESRDCLELSEISDLVQDTYVVQLDSDTLTSRVVPEVIQCIAENRSFTLLGDRSFPEIETMTSMDVMTSGGSSRCLR